MFPTWGETRTWTAQGPLPLNSLRCFRDAPGATPPTHTHSHTGFGCPSRALVPQISPPQPVQPIPPIRPRRRGSAVTHRRAGAVGGPECAHFLTARTCPALLEHSPSGPPADVFCPRGGSARQPPPLSLLAKPRAAPPPPTSHNWHLQGHQESRG